jgi:hypothetical protein
LLEVLTDDVNATLFDEATPGSFEHTLTRLCADAGLRERLAQGAQDTIERLDLTWLGNARRVVGLAQKLVSMGR